MVGLRRRTGYESDSSEQPGPNSSFTIVDLVADHTQPLVGLRLPGTYRILSGRDCALSGDQRIPCCNRSS